MDVFIRNLSKKQAKLCIYTMPVHMATSEREYPFLENQWLLAPAPTWNCFKDLDGSFLSLVPLCPTTPARHLYAARTEALLRRHPDLGGLYYDICGVPACSNPLHGCGGVDAFGKRYRSSIAMGLRAYLMDIYKLHRHYGMVLLNHAHNYFFPFVHDFGDIWYPGERYLTECSENPEFFYFEGISPEEYQCAYNAEIRGTGIIEIIQLNRVVASMPSMSSKAKEIMSREYGIHAMAPALLHNVGIDPGTWGEGVCIQWWHLKKHIRLPEATFHPYWVDPIAESHAPSIKCSWYSWSQPSAPYKAMLVIANSSRQPAAMNLKTNWNKMGIAAEQAVLTDLMTNQPLPVSALQKHRLKGNHFMLIGIRQK